MELGLRTRVTRFSDSTVEVVDDLSVELVDDVEVGEFSEEEELDDDCCGEVGGDIGSLWTTISEFGWSVGGVDGGGGV